MSSFRPLFATVFGIALAASMACSSSSSPSTASKPADAGHDAHVSDGGGKGDSTARDGASSDGASASDANPEATATDASDAGPEVADPMAPPLLTLDCDPMVPTECGFPYPSNVWTVADTTTATGLHIYFGPTTLPLTKGNIRIGTKAFATRDGFPQGAAIMTHLPNATTTGLPTHNTIATSITQASPTLLMEADTGAFVPHFSELDVRDVTSPPAETFLINPVVRLKDATRYIVAIRHVVDANGNALPVNPVFAALRDNTASTDLSVPPRRALYADIMSKLKANGVDTTDLQLAWDFTTASQANTTQWLTSMRDDALTKVGAAGPSYTIDSVDTNPNPYIYKRLHGTMTVPFYLTTTTVPASLNLGSNGLPAQNGTATFPFLVHIPNSLVTANKAGPILINAHGLLGDETEGEDGYLAEICNREGYVAIAVNLVGMDSADVGFIGGLLGGDASQFEQAVEMQHQGLLNELLAVRMMMGGLAADPATAPNGTPLIDPTHRYYRGDSQGNLGATFMSISTDITRGLLGEPGAPYSMILNRSSDFSQFFLLLDLNFRTQLDIQFALGLLDTLWFRTEPGGYVGYMRQNLLENTPAHDVLIHAGLGDQQVSPLGAEFIARTIGAQNLQAVNSEIYGLTDAPSGFSGSGFVLWNFGLPTAPLTDTPPTAGPDPHDELRYVPAAQDMADQFFRTGLVNQTCPDGGPCKVVCGEAGVSSCTTTP